MLNFLGTGSAFTKNNGNTSAYYINDCSLLLIDCGESTFNEILKEQLLAKITDIYILITHFHSDHIGSLGSLLFYCDYLGLSNISIIFPNIQKLKELIHLYGLQSNLFQLKLPNEITEFNIKEYRQTHSNMEAYGYLIKLGNKLIFYSGDSKTIPKDILDNIDKIDAIYQDVRDSNYPHHLSLTELDELIPQMYRYKIKCMHYPDDTDLKKISNEGYCVVKRKRLKNER